jgi:ribosomal protein L7Ae-like RNA K-turn-binding protein
MKKNPNPTELDPGINQKIITVLQFAKKAGKLISGSDAVQRFARSGKVKLIILTTDLAFQSRRKIFFLNQNLNIPLVTWGTKNDTMQFSPKEAGIIAITDQNFANGVLKYLSYNEVEE